MNSPARRFARRLSTPPRGRRSPASIARLLLPAALALCLSAQAAPAAKAGKTAAAAPAAASAWGEGYQLPPKPLQAIVDAPRPPQLSISPHRDLVSMVRTPSLPGIEVVAQPELKLAGMRIHPRVRAASRFSFGSGLELLEIASGKTVPIEGLPSPLSLATLQWSPDQRWLAFNRVDAASGANELWLVELETRRARKLVSGLNTVAGRGYEWMPDSRRLLVRLQPDDQGEAPAAAAAPSGPATQESQSGGGVRQVRTYQDLLRNESDARLFAYYLRSQLASVDLAGQTTKLGAPDLFMRASVSPDGRHVLTTRLERPFSYLVPADMFARRVEVLDGNGRFEYEIARLPLVDGLPTGNDAVPTGPREVQWRGDAPATLVWAEAQDGGDPARAVEIRDAVFMQAAPFDKPPQTLARLGARFEGAHWGSGELALIDEFWWKTRKIRQWRIAPDHGDRAPELLRDGSSEDRYNDPGQPVTVMDAGGGERLLTSADGNSLYYIGEGASAEGERPFLDRLDLSDKRRTRLFQSQAPYFERPLAVLDDAATRALTMRESPTEPANLQRRELGGDAAPVALTHFPHPTPQLRDIKKELIRYKRNDGVELTANLYLPPGYDAKRDGPLPMLMYAYPAEFKSADAASQVIGSPYEFNAVSYWGPLPYLAMGYAVLDNPTMPIVGEGEREPNDTYIAQLTASAQAAVDEVVRRGVADRNRIAISGHSYGAFMTANLLAHTRLFKAGIARSGAYNRTLTPFGFQAEERNYWQAQPTYEAMSPFNFADKIKDPLLLIHGEQDNNSGTFPIQSERMYAAIKGLGGKARLVMLPNESHGYRARESILHMLAETNRWLETYVKNAKPEAGQGTKAAK
ncbi:prolyl oligopeptidase family serine peptidase [Lysobacter sp. K5869]|uniref:prolyl oligopeptidase family serine peptidase n=1 Tax=Lysobacter sp. K5869 TaxID=2820808 RepID=UPI001C064773|nr:prolyl oligopeptidase family serine peptidase [Lysobacter sp. K5869]QWP76660.1 prolyl oligopeptidase family serine peptidase [Lysobacter sp. K5869]